jgi:hypothetical protein
VPSEKKQGPGSLTPKHTLPTDTRVEWGKKPGEAELRLSEREREREIW